EASAADRVIAVDFEPGHGLPGVDGKWRSKVIRVAKDGGGHVHRAFLRPLGVADGKPVRRDVRSVLPALVTRHRAEEVNGLVALRGRVRKVAMLVRERAAAERERPAGRAGTSRENLNHSRERRDAVER